MQKRFIDANELFKNLSMLHKTPKSIEDSMAIGYNFAVADACIFTQKQPTADVVDRAVYDQVAWERDTAIEQLRSIGKGFGETMDDVVKLRHGKWIWMGDKGDSRFMCSVCKWKEEVPTCMGVPNIWEYCPSCGAYMREESDNEVV